MVPFDTTPEAAAVQLEILRRLSPARRFQIAVEMSDFVCECQRAALRRGHPELTDAQLRAALLELRYGFRLPGQ